MPKKTQAQLERDLRNFLGGGSKFWPGGSGGGGARKGGRGTAVIRPHVRTSPGCTLCNRLHSMEEHEKHGGDAAVSAAAATTKTRTKAKAKVKAKVKAKAKSKPMTKPTKKPTKTSKKVGSTPKAKTARKSNAHGKPKTAPSPIAARMPAPIAAPSDPLPVVLDAIRRVPASGRFGKQKVFISALWDRVGSKIAMSLPQFKAWLIAANRNRQLDLARADLVGAMDQDLVSKSEIDHMGATFHFVIDRDAPAF